MSILPPAAGRTRRSHMSHPGTLTLSLFLLSLRWHAHSHYAAALSFSPHLPARDYAHDDILPILTSAMSSPTSLIPYDYFSVPHCRPLAPSQASKKIHSALKKAARKAKKAAKAEAARRNKSRKKKKQPGQQQQQQQQRQQQQKQQQPDRTEEQHQQQGQGQFASLVLPNTLTRFISASYDADPDPTFSTTYSVAMHHDRACAAACTVRFADLPAAQLAALRHRVAEGYRAHLYLDHLPVVERAASHTHEYRTDPDNPDASPSPSPTPRPRATLLRLPPGGLLFPGQSLPPTPPPPPPPRPTPSKTQPPHPLRTGYPLGARVGGDLVLHNHLSFVVHVRDTAPGRFRVDAFEVIPSSIDYASHRSGRQLKRQLEEQQQHVLRSDGNGDDNSEAARRRMATATDSDAQLLCDTLPHERFPLRPLTRNPSPPLRISNATVATFTYDVSFIRASPPPSQSGLRAQDTDADPDVTATAVAAEVHRRVRRAALANAAALAFLLCAACGVVLLRTARRRQGVGAVAEAAADQGDGDAGAAGWRRLGADVFRPPQAAPLLAVAVAAGVQVLLLAACALAFLVVPRGLAAARAGIADREPDTGLARGEESFPVVFMQEHVARHRRGRGAVVPAMMGAWLLSSLAAGYVSYKLYVPIFGGGISCGSGARSGDGSNGSNPVSVGRNLVTFATAVAFPGAVLTVLFALNLFLWALGSSATLSLPSQLALLCLWALSVPVVFIGALIGRRRSPPQPLFHGRTNKQHRPIPALGLGFGLVTPDMYCALLGLLPFATVFIELVFALEGLRGESVHLHGAADALVLLPTVGLLPVVCAAVGVVSTYVLLACEDWASHWHTSFWGPAAGGVYVFLYCLYHAVAGGSQEARTPVVGQIVFVVGSLVFSAAFSLMCGAVGFLASLAFTRKMYSSIRAD